MGLGTAVSCGALPALTALDVAGNGAGRAGVQWLAACCADYANSLRCAAGACGACSTFGSCCVLLVLWCCGA